MSTIERLAELAKGATQGRRSLGNENNECCDISLSDELDLRVSLDRHDGCTGKIIIDREQMIANAHFIIECSPAAIAQAHAEYAELERRNAELVKALQRMVDNAIASCDIEDDGTHSVSMTEQEWGDHCAATDAACLVLAHSAQEKADAQ